ncbi:MAG: hypothetical protein AAGU25_08920, partial [bacterium]
MALKEMFSEINRFSSALYDRMLQIHPGMAELELYEFRYALKNILPDGWEPAALESVQAIEKRIASPEFYTSIQLKPVRHNRIVLDAAIEELTRMLFTGLVSRDYPADWINQYFYFDIRSFAFFPRTRYVTAEIAHLFGDKPYMSFPPAQKNLEALQDIGYKEYAKANAKIDQAFINTTLQLIAKKGTPLVLTIVGPTAAGKSEITLRLQQALEASGKTCTNIEMDNFYKDREFRDGKPMDTRIIHYGLFLRVMQALQAGIPAELPQYDFILATSSHDLEGNLRPGCETRVVQPADIILLEGNFPFHIPEISPLVDIKAVYFAEDSIRLKRKWRRDVDYRKKYDPAYLSNRYFRTQFQRNEEIYQPMMKCCELVVDTSAA